jgi:hypothetical protein
MFLSTPLTVACMVILAQFDGTRWIAILLSEDGDPQGSGTAPGGQKSAAETTKSPVRRKVSKGDLKS